MRADEAPVWSVRVRHEGPARASAFADQAKVTLSPYDGLQSRGDLANPIQLALAAAASEIMGAMLREASRRRWLVDGVEAQAKATLVGVMAAVGVQGEEGPSQFESIRIQLSMAADADEDELQTAFEAALLRCPVWQSLKKGCEGHAFLRTL